MKIIIALFLAMWSFSGCIGMGTTNHVTEKQLQAFYAVDYKDGSSTIVFHIAKGPNFKNVDVSVDGKSVGHLSQDENLLCAIIVKEGTHTVSLVSSKQTKEHTINVSKSSKYLVNIQSRNLTDESLTLSPFNATTLRGAKLYQITDLR